jgi:hypothetical protein
MSIDYINFEFDSEMIKLIFPKDRFIGMQYASFGQYSVLLILMFCGVSASSISIFDIFTRKIPFC